jgi:hypothetical protein
MGREPDILDEILTSRQARELLKIGRTKLWELTINAQIPAYRIGDGKTSGLRYKRSELLRWLDAHRVSGTKAGQRALREDRI